MTIWVVKVGTSLLRGTSEKSTAEVIQIYSESIAACISQGNQVILVSSGAVGLGCYCLGIKDRPRDVISL